jgi:uncharacterized protein
MHVVDSNVLIYAANDDVPEHEQCLEHLQTWGNEAEPWYVTWGVIYEFLRVATHPRAFARPLGPMEASEFVRQLLSYRSLSILDPTDRHLAVLRDVVAEVPDVAGNVFFDVRTAVLMREHGIRRIVTRDRDFQRFPFLEVVDPLS